jgi:hypothetical protein
MAKQVKYTGIPTENGTFTTFYKLKGRKTIAFKDFESKDLAIDAMDSQKTLSNFGLAPKVYGKVRKIDYIDDCGNKRRSNWGYITEIARVFDERDDDSYDEDMRDEIETLANEIEMWTGISFYDCHRGNVGYIKREGKEILVCIDTGAESFSGEYAY